LGVFGFVGLMDCCVGCGFVVEILYFWDNCVFFFFCDRCEFS